MCSVKSKDPGVAGVALEGGNKGREIMWQMVQDLVDPGEDFVFALSEVGVMEGSRQRRDLTWFRYSQIVVGEGRWKLEQGKGDCTGPGG